MTATPPPGPRGRRPQADPPGAGPASTEETITRLLLRWSEGGQEAVDQMLPRVLDELRRTAARLMRGEATGHTLDPTALVHELYLRLRQRRTVRWKNRYHFFGFSAQAMRRILIDHAKAKARLKRRAGEIRVPLEEASSSGPLIEAPRSVDLLALDQALIQLEKLEPRQCRVVELRYFLGLRIDEIAEVLRINPATVHRDWASARAWLYRELTRREAGGSSHTGAP